MIGLLFLGFFGFYLYLSIWLTRRAVKGAKERGIAGWKFGLPMALVMYHLVFWEWIPTMVAHKYNCSKYGGFTVYKTLEEWKGENPGVAETLLENKVSIQRVGDTENYTDTQNLNQRFRWKTKKNNFISFLPIYRFDDQVEDSITGEVLAHNIDFSSGRGRDYLKFWMNNRSCSGEPGSRKIVYQFVEKVIKITERGEK